MKITDLEPYEEYLDEFDMSYQQKLEFVNALAQIVDLFVSRAFSNNPIQLAVKESLASPKKAAILFMDWLYA